MQIETVTVSKCKGVWLAEFSQPPGMVVRQEFKGLFWTLFQSSLNLRYSGNHNFLFWCILTFTFTAVLLRNAGTFLFCHLWPGEKFRLLHCQIQWFCVCVCAHTHTHSLIPFWNSFFSSATTLWRQVPLLTLHYHDGEPPWHMNLTF